MKPRPLVIIVSMILYQIPRQLVTRSPTRLKLEASTRPAPLQVDRPDPEGQRHATCRSVEAGYALNDDDDDYYVNLINVF